MTQDERDQRQRQLADQAARAELTGYAGNVSAAAEVRIPDEILNPPLELLKGDGFIHPSPRALARLAAACGTDK